MAVAQNRLVEWFNEWHLPLRRFLLRRRVGTMSDVQDIAQEVFLRLLRYDRTDMIEHPQAYLYKIAMNVAAEWSTRRGWNLPQGAEWLDDLVDAVQPETVLEQQESEAELSRAVIGLPPRMQQILKLHYAEGATSEMIAKRLGLTRRMVKRDLARAYALLRDALDVGADGASGL